MNKRYSIAALIILSLMIFLSYMNVINAEFQFDDELVIVNSRIIKNPDRLSDINFLTSVVSGGRPVTDATFALNYYYGRLDPRGYHIVNIFLHICVSILVFFFVKKTLHLANSKDELSPDVAALAVSFLFALHPVNTQSVSYISQRAVLLCTFFYIIAVLLFIKSTEQTGFKKPVFYMAAIVVSILAMGSKTTAVSLPFMLLLYDYSFLKERSFSDRIRLSGPLIGTGIIFSLFFLFKLGNDQNVGFFIKEIDVLHYVLTQFRVILTYMRLLLLPVSQNLDYDYPLSRSIFEIPTLLSMISIFLLIGLAFVLRTKYKLISFGLFWFFVALSPESSFVPVADVIFEHRVYLPSIGFFLSCSLIAHNTSRLLFHKYDRRRRNRILAVIVISVLIALSVATHSRNEVWKSRLSLWSDVLAKSPGKTRAHYNLAHALRERGLHDDAVRELEETLQGRDDNSVKRADVYSELGVALFEMGRIDEAIAQYEKGLKLEPGNVKLLNNMSIALVDKGMPDYALTYAEMALKIQPLNGDIHNSIGEIYFKKGDYSTAAKYFIEAITINPDVPLRYWNTAICMEKLGNREEAYNYISLYLSLEKNEAERQEGLIYRENLKKSLEVK